MTPERRSTELDPTQVADFAATFLSRGDYYPRQKDNGGYFVVEKPLHLGVVMAHIRGAPTIGAYALSPTNEAKWLCFDADDPEHWKVLKAMALALTAKDVMPVSCRKSRGNQRRNHFLTDGEPV